MLQRLGKIQLEAWEDQMILPPGWHLDVAHVIKEISAFAKSIQTESVPTCPLLITSNGIARYFLSLVEADQRPLYVKMPTASLSHLCYQQESQTWLCTSWGKRPI